MGFLIMLNKVGVFFVTNEGVTVKREQHLRTTSSIDT